MTSAAISRARKQAAIKRGPNPYKADPPDQPKCANCGRHLVAPTGLLIGGGACDRCVTIAREQRKARLGVAAAALARRKA